MLPVWVCLTLAFGMISEYGNGWDLSAIIFIPLFLLWSAVFLIRAVVDFCRGKWRQGTLCLAAYAITLPVLQGALQLGSLASDDLHLYLDYPVYMAQIRSHAGKPAEQWFYWGTSGMVGSIETDRYLIYDPTDRWAKAVGIKPTPDGGWMTVTHLSGHFYLQVDADD